MRALQAKFVKVHNLYISKNINFEIHALSGKTAIDNFLKEPINFCYC